MEKKGSKLILCRHGETEWSKGGRHTGLTDVPLTDIGRKEAQMLKERLPQKGYAAVFSSPLERALKTCQIAGFASPKLDQRLLEWNYGEYEGWTSPEIQVKNPGWNVFDQGAPGGESVQEVDERARSFIDDVEEIEGLVLAFSSAHFSRALVGAWIEAGAQAGKRFVLSTAHYCILGYEHSNRVVIKWNA